jgi:hypothetical protein
MTDYRIELKGAIRGNARLRRRLDAAKHRVGELEQAIRLMVLRADLNGRGDDIETRIAAERIGWHRDQRVADAIRSRGLLP